LSIENFLRYFEKCAVLTIAFIDNECCGSQNHAKRQSKNSGINVIRYGYLFTTNRPIRTHISTSQKTAYPDRIGKCYRLNAIN